MVDTFGHLRGRLLLLLFLWDCGQRLSVVHKSTGGRPRQFPAAKAAAFVEESEFDVGVANPQFARLGLLDRHGLADQGLADEDQVAGPFDHAVRAHAPHGAVVRIIGLAQGARISAIGGAIERRRRLRNPRPRAAVRGCRRARNSSKRRCCSASVAAGGSAASAFRVRCMRSWRPFCVGLPGSIRSGRTPSLIHHTASRDSPPAPTDANGGPLSERIASGNPNWQNAASNTGRTYYRRSAPPPGSARDSGSSRR